MRTGLLWTLLWALVGCHPAEGLLLDTDDTGQFPADVDRYDPEHLTVVVGQVEDGEWEALLAETRLFFEIILVRRPYCPDRLRRCFSFFRAFSPRSQLSCASRDCRCHLFDCSRIELPLPSPASPESPDGASASWRLGT